MPGPNLKLVSTFKTLFPILDDIFTVDLQIMYM